MRRPRADPLEQAQTAAYLAISGEIAEQERTVQRLRSIQQLFFAWLTLGNVLLAAVPTVIGALFVKFETVNGRTFYRWFFALLVAASVGAASYYWWLYREMVRDASVGLAKLREQRRLVLSRGMADLVGARRRYREEIQGFIEEYRGESKRNRRIHNYFQSVILVGSIATTGVTSAIGQLSWLKWLAAGLSFSVGISAGFTGYYKFRERAMNQRQTADAIEQEYNAAELGIRKYKDQDGDQVLAELAENVENLREEQRKREQQLEQPSESRTDLHNAPQSFGT